MMLLLLFFRSAAPFGCDLKHENMWRILAIVVVVVGWWWRCCCCWCGVWCWLASFGVQRTTTALVCSTSSAQSVGDGLHNNAHPCDSLFRSFVRSPSLGRCCDAPPPLKKLGADARGTVGGETHGGAVSPARVLQTVCVPVGSVLVHGTPKSSGLSIRVYSKTGSKLDHTVCSTNTKTHDPLDTKSPAASKLFIASFFSCGIVLKDRFPVSLSLPTSLFVCVSCILPTAKIQRRNDDECHCYPRREREW